MDTRNAIEKGRHRAVASGYLITSTSPAATVAQAGAQGAGAPGRSHRAPGRLLQSRWQLGQ